MKSSENDELMRQAIELMISLALQQFEANKFDWRRWYSEDFYDSSFLPYKGRDLTPTAIKELTEATRGHLVNATDCGTTACMAGIAALHPYFNKLGITPKIFLDVFEHGTVIRSFSYALTKGYDYENLLRVVLYPSETHVFLYDVTLRDGQIDHQIQKDMLKKLQHIVSDKERFSAMLASKQVRDGRLCL